ncbi:MAG: TlpA disulfide reductase family protein [Bacteroidaceae bacterium]|nr:TlpA disulfide reductase family protein [Bacteroidaceae bacterium]
MRKNLFVVMCFGVLSCLHTASAQTRDILEIIFPTGTEGFVEVYNFIEGECDTLPIVNGRMVMEQSNLPNTLQLKYMKECLDSNKVWISINQGNIRRGDLIVGHGHTILTIDSLSSRRITGVLEDEFGDFEACDQYWRDRKRFRSEEFLKAHSQSVWALYHLDLDWDADTLQKALNCFSESLRNSERGKKLQQLILDRKNKTGVAMLFPMWDTAGKAHSFAECMGDKDYMLLNLWASWCGPCRAEIPDLMAYYEECRERVVFVSVTVDKKQEDWLKAVNEVPKYEWPNLASKFDGTPEGRPLPLLFDPGYIPFFFIIDRHGNTVYSSLEQETDDRPLDDAKRRLDALLTKSNGL